MLGSVWTTTVGGILRQSHGKQTGHDFILFTVEQCQGNGKELNVEDNGRVCLCGSTGKDRNG